MIRAGIDDERFIRGDVPMTKAEIRAMVMVKAQIAEDDVVWDVGAGTGSITIEAALQAKRGRVFAIERNPEGVKLIKKNAVQFGLDNIEVVHGSAPDALEGLPSANVIIIGGSGGNLEKIFDICEQSLIPNGRIVCTAVTVETAYRVVADMRRRKWQYDGFQMQVNRLRKAGPYHLFQPISPIFIITATTNQGGSV